MEQEALMPDTAENLVKAAQKQGFLQGFLLGLGVLGLFALARNSAPPPKKGGLDSDWKAVGNDFRTVMRRANELR
jgi:hypothetical protein